MRSGPVAPLEIRRRCPRCYRRDLVAVTGQPPLTVATCPNCHHAWPCRVTQFERADAERAEADRRAL